jgi:hypothetical protein
MNIATSISDRLRVTGKAIHEATASDAGAALNSGIAEVIKFPFACSAGRLVDSAGNISERFACVVHAARNGVDAIGEDIPADNACAVVDLIEELSLEELRLAHARGLAVKRLQKTVISDVGKMPVAVGTMSVIYARHTSAPVDVITEELQRLNDGLDHSDWIDMVAISGVAVISYACQFAGRSDLGGIMPPAKGTKGRYSPAWYVIPTMQASKDGTFNKVFSFIASYTVFFYPGVTVLDYNSMQDGVCKTIVTFPGYQYNVGGDIRPVPPEHYAGRLLPPRPFLVEGGNPKELLASLSYIPWQDGGVILLKGKLPLEGLMVFLGRDALKKGGTIRSGPESQESYVLPITPADFTQMMTRLRNQSNMTVRQIEPKFVMEKMSDEGTRSPFMARIFMGLLQLRDTVYPNPKERLSFDRVLNQALTPLMAARTAAREIQEAWQRHDEEVESGAAVTINNGSLEVAGDFYRTFRREVNSFLYDAAKALKEGGQKVGKHLGKDICFMFQKQKPYQTGLEALRRIDPALAAYVQTARDSWSERLINARNDLDHNGWTLPRIRYEIRDRQPVIAHQPLIDGVPVVEFVTQMLDRVSCFTEDFLAYCLQARLPEGADITEIPIPLRPAQAPERFRFTLRHGGKSTWQLVYPVRKFEET